MNIGTCILLFYKNRSLLLKIILFPVLILGCLLWIIGSLAHTDTLLMFLVGVIVGGVLFYLFGTPIVEWITSFIQKFTS